MKCAPDTSFFENSIILKMFILQDAQNPPSSLKSLFSRYTFHRVALLSNSGVKNFQGLWEKYFRCKLFYVIQRGDGHCQEISIAVRYIHEESISYSDEQLRYEILSFHILFGLSRFVLWNIKFFESVQ